MRLVCFLLLAVFFPAALPAQGLITVTAAPGTVQLAPGVTGTGWFYDGQLPGPVIRVTEGDRLQLRFLNQLPEESTIHFHGVRMPLGMDGVPGVSRPPVLPGQEFTYDFVVPDAGTYFFHPHVGIQLDQGLYGVLIVDPLNPSGPAPDKEFVIVLDDWRNGLPIPGASPSYSAFLINGKTSAGQTPMTIDSGDVVKLRVVNASAATNYVFALDGHQLTVVSTDGQDVQPVAVGAVPIGAGERYDVTFTANNPGAWSFAVSDLHARSQTLVRGIMRYSGSTAPNPSPSYTPTNLASGLLMNYSMLAGVSSSPLAATPDRTYSTNLSWAGPTSYIWSINGQQWPNATPYDVTDGEDVRFVLQNFTPHAHPMHVHGHHFRLHGTAGGTTNPVIKDTILLHRFMMGGPGGIPTETADMLADNPGKWMYHCHHLYHAEAGMMTTVRYVNGDRDGDGLGDGVDLDPLSPFPVLTKDALGGGFMIGTMAALNLQWPQGSVGTFYVGPEVAPISVGAAGIVHIWPLQITLGSAIATPLDVASLQLSIPNLPSLQGAMVTLQAAATHPTLAPPLRASTPTRVHIY